MNYELRILRNIDILCEMNEAFYNAHPGWAALAAVEEIQAVIEKQLNCKVDFALNEIGKKYGYSAILRMKDQYLACFAYQDAVFKDLHGLSRTNTFL